MRQDVSLYPEAHRAVTCKLLCVDTSTCLFYQLHAALCYLCVYDAQQFSDAQLVAASELDRSAHVRQGADVTFGSEYSVCMICCITRIAS